MFLQLSRVSSASRAACSTSLKCSLSSAATNANVIFEEGGVSLVRRGGGVQGLVLGRAPVNALDTATLRGITKAIQKAELAAKESSGKKSDEAAGHALVIESSLANVFSAGLALESMMLTDAELAARDTSRVRDFWHSLQDMFLTLYSSPLATVACLTGHAPAGGLLIAISCDARIGTKSSKFKLGLNEAQFGLVAPFWFAKPLAACVGTRKAEKMVQLAEMLSFEEAHKAGILDELCETEEATRKRAFEVAQLWNKHGLPDARYKSKLLLRRKLIEELTKGRDKDTEYFLGIATSDFTQASLRKYLASLKKKA